MNRGGRIISSTMRLILPLFVAAFSAHVLAASPLSTLIRSRDIAPGDIQLGPASGAQFEIAIASSDEQFLAVWSDARNGQIRGTRISAAGNVLDPLGLTIARATFPARHPAVAWNGSEYVVTWETGSRVFATFVNRDGEVVSAAPVSIPVSFYESFTASDGSDTLVVTRGFVERQQALLAAVLGRDTCVKRSGVVITTNTQVSKPSVTWNGTEYVVVWTESPLMTSRGWSIILARLNNDGTLIERRAVVSDLTYSDAPVSASNGSLTFIAYRTPELVGLLVNGAGDRVAGPFILSENTSEMARAIWDGRDFIVVWTQQTGVFRPKHESAPQTQSGLPPQELPLLDVFASRVSPTGEVRHLGVISPGGSSDMYPAIARNGFNVFVGWIRLIYGSLALGTTDVFGQTLERAAAGELPSLLAWSAPNQTSPAIAWNGEEYVLVWEEEIDIFDRRAIFAASVNRSGKITKAPHRVTDNGTYGPPHLVAANGVSLLTWSRADHADQAVYGRWMGEVESDAFITSGRALATDGHHFLVATGGRGAIFEPGATVPAATFTIELPGEISEVVQTSAAWTGDAFLLAMTVCRRGSGCGDGSSDVVAVRVTPDGTVLDRRGIGIAVSPQPELRPSVACGTGRCLVTWDSLHLAGMTVVGSQGAIVRQTVTPRSPQFLIRTIAAAAANEFYVVWQRSAPDSEIRGTRLGADGTVIEGSLPEGVPVVGSDETEVAPALLTANGGVALAYARTDPAAGGVYRVFLRLPDQPERRRGARR